MDGPGSRHGRHHRALVALTALVAGGAAGAALPDRATAASPLDPRIPSALAADPTHTVPVVVTLRGQVDTSGIAGDPHAVGTALRRAVRTQGPVVRILGPGTRRFWIVNAVAGRAGASQIRRLSRLPSVASVRLDTRAAAHALAVPPLGSAGEGNWGIDDVRARAAWARGVTGKGVRIGSIDTGVDPTNPALAGKVVAFRDFVHGRPDAYDDNGHGTHTVGVMVGGRTSGTPIGVAPEATVIVAKAMDADGVGPGSSLIEAAQWMADPDGNPATRDEPAVVNNSWSAPDPNDPWFRSILRVWQAMGIVPVFAAGNAGTIGSPAGYPDVITVGAHDEDRKVPTFSGRASFPWTALDGTGPAAGTLVAKPDVTAPGVAIMSTYGNGYMTFTGTSMAAPHVAGVVALLRQAKPDLTPAAALALVRASATDIGAPGPEADSGAGAVNAEVAVASILGPAQSPNDAAPSTQSTEKATPSKRVAGIRVSRRRPASIVVTGTGLTRSAMRVVVTRAGRVVMTRRLATVPGKPFAVKLTPRRGAYRVTVTSTADQTALVELSARISVK